MSDDLPAVTRWSFQDLQEAYDMRFIGRAPDRKQQQQQQQQQSQQQPDVRLDLPVDEEKPREAAIYERYLPKANGSSDPVPSQDRWKLKPASHLFVGEMQELAETILKDVVRGNPGVSWETIKGLDNAKRLLKEAVVMPIKYPQYFTGLLSPWKGILLFGPPGTGKTMLAKAVASECNTTFFNISASSIVSKYRGDSEKLVRVLFQLARYYAPSTIFLDEIDAIISQRGEAKSEHEASRRLKTELLIQMDGLTQTNDLVFLLAATNIPWELDAAMLRRLEKRILVPLPEPEARRAMFEDLLSAASNGGQLPYDEMVAASEGYSGSDIRIVCKEAAMRPLRRLMFELEKIEESNKGKELTTEDMPVMGPITEEDVVIALKMTRPSAHLDSSKYDKFNRDFGSHVMS